MSGCGQAGSRSTTTPARGGRAAGEALGRPIAVHGVTAAPLGRLLLGPPGAPADRRRAEAEGEPEPSLAR